MENFTLALYDLSGDNVVLTQTLKSFTSYLPSSTVLSTSSTTYKLVLAYTVPVYPAHWSIGATELIISNPRSSSKNFRHSLHDEDQTSSGSMCVISTRTTRALDVPSGFLDDEKLRTLRDQYSRKVSCITDTQTDGKWVVLAPAEITPPSTASSYSSISANITTQDTSFLNSSTSLQLYRLFLPPTSNSVAAPTPKLTFVRSLHGQTGPIASLALADGRCVSLGLNGSLWVWDLETSTGAEVCGLRSDQTAAGFPSPKCMVAFDDRRIITTSGSQVVVYRFDI
ncbi:hypothetical protein C0993_000697 [Termitomyces sp. T159_Od127]|nr:hypothetical protein C0993_000697 [Termitomyces sp. T159_Od127]